VFEGDGVRDTVALVAVPPLHRGGGPVRRRLGRRRFGNGRTGRQVGRRGRGHGSQQCTMGRALGLPPENPD
jgi:hypothetical protein